MYQYPEVEDQLNWNHHNYIYFDCVGEAYWTCAGMKYDEAITIITPIRP